MGGAWADCKFPLIERDSQFGAAAEVKPLNLVVVLDISGPPVGVAPGKFSTPFDEGLFKVTPVPEPASLALMLGGLGLLTARMRRRPQA